MKLPLEMLTTFMKVLDILPSLVHKKSQTKVMKLLLGMATTPPKALSNMRAGNDPLISLLRCCQKKSVNSGSFE